ncbi:MAG: ATP-binding cassette domain-containing protein [Saprospiraceae bacterium]|nr:ATP-binding cassette domain-containing protein [Bacteroidia bacterium]NNE13585.1 ATP-binding cassette domain-containing protein [Saprospiraceae bacterium]NNL92932.1 ATP-binding cassette domain-containing protein [Saprospiraceae bacterium]
MIKTSNIIHKFSDSVSFEFPDIICEQEKTLLVLGQSGVGKTTLLHILAGILKPTSGDVFIGNTPLYGLKGHKLDKFRGKNIGLVFQKPHFVQSVTAEENLFLAQKMAGQPLDKKLSAELLDALNLNHRKTAKTYEMSQGEQQRLSIARALINKPRLILADEPTSALDDKNCEEVIKLLEQHSENVKAALVVVTHDNRLKDFFSNNIELH